MGTGLFGLKGQGVAGKSRRGRELAGPKQAKTNKPR
jgi:hypothetical protein